MRASSFTFIPNHAITVEPCIPSAAMVELVKRWDHYDTEKNDVMMKYIWKIISEYIPKTCNYKSLIGYEIDKTVLTRNKNKSKNEEIKKCKGGVSLITVLVFAEDKNFVKFYDNKTKGISFLQPNAEFYKLNVCSGNVAIFTNEVAYEIPETTHFLKIPIFYKQKLNENTYKLKKVRFKKTFEIPTPNGEKFNKVQFLDKGRIVILTPNIYEEENMKRWNEVEKREKKLRIPKKKLPEYINTKKGRPPTEDEDYCPNCYEILSTKNPIEYNNCSGCLSPIN